MDLTNAYFCEAPIFREGSLSPKHGPRYIEQFLNYKIYFVYQGSIHVNVCENSLTIFTGSVNLFSKEFQVSTWTPRLKQIDSEEMSGLISYIVDYSLKILNEYDEKIEEYLTNEEKEMWERHMKILIKDEKHGQSKY